MIDMGNGQVATPLIDATNAKIANPNYDCSSLRDPLWALKDQTYRYAPDEPETVDWSQYVAPASTGSATDFNGAQEEPPRLKPNEPLYNFPQNLIGNPIYIPESVYNSRENSVYSPLSSLSSGSGGGGFHSKAKLKGNKCPEKYTGYHAVSGCNSYVYCQNGNIVGASQPCVPGTLFDVTIGVCTWAANVNCGQVS